MTLRPPPSEWCVTHLPVHRRAYLASNVAFEDIIEDMVSGVEIFHSFVRPYSSPPDKVAKDATQVIFVLEVGNRICDLLYNAPDGLRARYWQSPEQGDRATRHLIDRLMHRLIASAHENPPTLDPKTYMSLAAIASSLKASSAKVWPKERDGETYLLREPPIEEQLIVRRWSENEPDAPSGPMWRRTPTAGALEIKGALLSPDGTEHVPPGKKKRSLDIHKYGFT